MKDLFALLNLASLPYYQLSEDLKLINICCGMTGATSKYPCPYGHCRKLSDGTWLVGQFRTIESIIYWYNKWLRETGGDKSKMKDYFNCINFPVVDPSAHKKDANDLVEKNTKFSFISLYAHNPSWTSKPFAGQP